LSSHNGVYEEFYHLDPEDGGYMLLRNVGGLSTDYTALKGMNRCLPSTVYEKHV
jgi:hypothetical protein